MTPTRLLVAILAIALIPVSSFANDKERKRQSFYQNLDYNALSNNISVWLKRSSDSSAVVNLTIESDSNVLGDMGQFFSNDLFASSRDGQSDNLAVKFYWSSTEVGRGGLSVMCHLRVEYDKSQLTVSNCKYIENEIKDLSTWEWLNAAREDGGLVQDFEKKSESYAGQSYKVLRFDQIYKNGSQTNLCDLNAVNDFKIVMVTGSEKKSFLDHAVTTFMNRRLNFFNNKCFGVVIEKQGSVSSATAVKENYLARVENGVTKYPTIWSPASSIYQNYAFGDNAKARFADGDPVVVSPLVFLFKRLHVDKYISDITHDGQLLIDPENPETIDPLVGWPFLDAPTTLGMTEMLFRSTSPNRLIKMKKRGNFKFQTTPGNTSNSGHHFQVLQVLEYLTAKLGGNFIEDDIIFNIDEAQFQSPDLRQFIETSSERVRAQYTSTSDLTNAMVTQSGIDAIFTYENSAIETLLATPDRQKYVILYPINNAESNHPAYILRETATAEEVEAAKIFLDFLRSREMQLLAMNSYGFRPLKTQLEADDGPLIDQAFGALSDELGVIADLEEEEINFISVPPASLIRTIVDTLEE